MQVRWSLAANVTRSRLPQVVSLVPLVGYALIWGDQLNAFLLRFPALGEGLWFDPLQRLQLIYFGGSAVFLGWIVYLIACPRPIKNFAGPHEYQRSIFDGGNAHELEEVFTTVEARLGFEELPGRGNEKSLGKYYNSALRQSMEHINDEDQRSATLAGQIRQSGASMAVAAYYELLDLGLDRQKSIPFNVLPTVVLALYVIGAILFFLPTLEVFLMVVRKTLPWWPGA